jgi:(E)-4-hydroxy-3-methylbut-2-enyl-diphosphate synthase
MAKANRKGKFFYWYGSIDLRHSDFVMLRKFYLGANRKSVAAQKASCQPDHFSLTGSMNRRASRSVAVGPQHIGGANAVSIQSMLSTPVGDLDGCRRQVEELLAASCFLIRLAIPTRRSLADFCRLRGAIRDSRVAFIADLHYGSELAMDALDVFEKVRINPGNFAIRRTARAADYDEDRFLRERDSVESQAREFFLKARRQRRAVRIGSNGGSIAARTEWNCGRGGEALLEGALEMARWAREAEFHDLVFSFKSSDALTTIAANKLARQRMDELGWHYPFHLGVTEAGNGYAGRAAGALGIGSLLSQGIGDSLRLSLTEPPLREVEFAKKLLAFCGEKPLPEAPHRQWPVAVVEDRLAAGCVEAPLSEEPFDSDRCLLETLHCFLCAEDLRAVHVPDGPHRSQRQEIAKTVLQCCRWGKFFTEIVACPTCGRTTYDVGGVVDGLRERFGNYPHLRIAVMGCVVNGIGEMGDADYGYIGCGNGKVNLYKRGTCVVRGIKEKQAIGALAKLLSSEKSEISQRKRGK